LSSTPSRRIKSDPAMADSPLMKSTSYQPACYFSIPRIQISDHSPHFSDETPRTSPAIQADTPSDPCNPLLACQPTPTYLLVPYNMDAPRLLQLQTSAAYSTQRPSPSSLQGSDSSPLSSSSRSSSSEGSMSPRLPLELYRCSRCHRTSSLGSLPGNMMPIGINNYYCNRCAAIVGYGG